MDLGSPPAVMNLIPARIVQIKSIIKATVIRRLMPFLIKPAVKPTGSPGLGMMLLSTAILPIELVPGVGAVQAERIRASTMGIKAVYFFIRQ